MKSAYKSLLLHVVWLLLTISISWLSGDAVFAQVPAYPFKAVHNQINLQENCALFEDVYGKGLGFVNRHPEAFLPFEDVPLRHNQAYWGKFTLVPKRDNNVTMVLDLGEADTISVFIPNNHGNYTRMLTGSTVATSKNDEILPNSNLLKIDIPPKGEFYNYTVFFRISGRYTLQIEPVLYDVGFVFSKVAEEGRQKRLLVGLYIGLFIFICMLTLTFYVFSRDRLYFFYCLFTALHVLYNVSVFQLSTEFLLGEFRHYNYLLCEITGFLYWITFLFFMQAFADTRDYFSKEHKLMNWLIVCSALLSPVGVYYVQFSAYAANYAIIRNVFLLLMFGFSIVIFYRLATSNNMNAKIIGIGGVFLSVGWILHFGVMLLGKESMKYFYQIGQVSQLAFFTYGLAYRFRQKDLAKQKSQSKLIRQLRINRTMEAEAKEDLERKVRVRTEEIQAQNEELRKRHEEILVHRDKIEAQKDEILAQRDELEEQTQWFLQQNAEVSASIHYARRLQEALLHSQEEVNKILPQHFIFYIPRDIVSGDFYWVEQVYNYVVVAAADCTGHGVPGAFMSLIGVLALNDIVMHREFTNPGLILDEMRSYIKRTLKQTGKQAEANDGIDVALSVIDIKNREMWYAGAFNPLIIIRNEELMEVKGDRMPVGVYYKKEEAFYTHEIKLEAGDTLYMYSDGFPDQIGGDDQKKFKSRNFKKLLTELSKLPMDEQKEQLFKTYLNWKGSNDQIDDILVMGIGID